MNVAVYERCWIMKDGWEISTELLDGDDYKWRCLDCGQTFDTWEWFDIHRKDENKIHRYIRRLNG